MHNSLSSKNNDFYSSWLLAIFVFVLIITAAYTKYFNIPGSQDHNLERIRILFNSNDLASVKTLNFKNRLGQFTIENFNSKKMGSHWLLTSPRRLFANENTINKIFKVLEDIRIKKVYPNDEITRANFSLNNPNMEITLKDNTNGSLKVSIGLINPIDNSTYIQSSDSDAIFHIQALPTFLEKLNFSDFIDSNISSVPFNKITTIKIFKKDSKSPQLHLLKDSEGEWQSIEGRLLDAESIKSYYDNLMTTQTHLILDAITEEQSEAVKTLLEKPIYTLKIYQGEQQVIAYDVSYLINNFPGLKIENKKFLLIQSSNKDYPYVYNKDILKSFYATQYTFKKRKK